MRGECIRPASSLVDVSREQLEKRFADFRAETTHHAAMKEAAIQFCLAMAGNRTPYSLSLLGPSGTGKTMLTRIITRFFKDWICDRKRDPGLTDGIWRCKGGFVSWGRALSEMLDTGDYARLAAYRGDFYIALDDIAAEHSKTRELSASKLFDVLNARLARRWTVITANCDLAGIDRMLDPRISSRLVRDGNVCITLPKETPDYSLQ